MYSPPPPPLCALFRQHFGCTIFSVQFGLVWHTIIHVVRIDLTLPLNVMRARTFLSRLQAPPSTHGTYVLVLAPTPILI